MRGLARLLSCLLVSLACPASAQDDERDAVHEAIGTLVTLSAGPGVSGARYHIDRVQLALQKLEFVAPLPFGLGRPLDVPAPEDSPGTPPWVVVRDAGPGPFLLEPVVAVRGGYLEADEPLRGALLVAFPGGRLEYRTASVGAGLGVRVQPWTWLRLEPRVDLVESRTTSRPDGPPATRDALRLLADDLVHWRADTLAVVGQLSTTLQLELGPVRLSPHVTFAWVHVETLSSSSPLQDGSGWSSLASAGLDLDIPLFGLALWGCPLRLFAGAAVTHYEGDAGRNFDYREILELPASLYFETRGRLPYLTRLGINGEYARGQDIEGWTVGVDFDLDF